MNLDHFIDRPRLSTVIICMLVLAGVIGYLALPVSQYPDVAPPQIQVQTRYPGASAETVASTVAVPLEQEINGVENMLYMSSQSTDDGGLSINITFKSGTDLDLAQVLVQNRVATAEPSLPEEVRRQGVTTSKNSPDMLMVINMFSDNGSLSKEFIGNYATIHVLDRLKRLDGVGNIIMVGASDYSMRIWLNPEVMSTLELTAQDVLDAIRIFNSEISSGGLNRQPIEKQGPNEYAIQSDGRLTDRREFLEIVVKTIPGVGVVKVRDVARVELGAETYSTRGYLSGDTAIAMPVFMRPGANALDTSDQILSLMDDLRAEFPDGLDYRVVYNPTRYIAASMQEVYTTLWQAVLLVVLVIILFLQSWRAALIPVIAIPVSLVATFSLMALLGFSLNMLTLFGLVLAIGIVVDDAIVVVENVERRLLLGETPNQAAKATMREVAGALVATSLVLVAVFIPTVLIEGITGTFYAQFGITIAAATMFSTVVSLTLSPAMAGILLRPRIESTKGLSGRFNSMVNRTSERYGRFVSWVGVRTLAGGAVYAVLVGFGIYSFMALPTGFVPAQDQGYAIVAVQLKPGSSLEATDRVVKRTLQQIAKVPDVAATVAFTGFSGATFTNASNAGAIFVPLKEMSERRDIDSIMADLRQIAMRAEDAFIVAIPPPPVPGIGNAGGIKLMLEDQAGLGSEALEAAAWGLSMRANQSAELSGVFTFFETKTPRYRLSIDKEKVRRLNVPLPEVVSALQIYLGSAYVNDFNFLGRVYRVSLQADGEYRDDPRDVLDLRVRNANGQMVPIGAFAKLENDTSSSRVPRYNLYNSAAVTADVQPGFSSGEAMARMEALALEALPRGITYEWTELAFQEKMQGNTAYFVFVLAVVMVFLLLAAQYESWSLPFAIILIVPMCLLSAALGLGMSGQENNVLTQIGLVVLVGLAAKNAILIVEFAKQIEQEQHVSPIEAAMEAARQRFRPILMTAFSFVLGTLPLLVSAGPGFEMRQAIGVTVFYGMLGVTLFGLLFTPMFYVVCRKLFGRNSKP